jgi:hypothetical protein
MNKANIPMELKEEALEIYQSTIDNREDDFTAVRKIQGMLTDHGLDYSDRTISRMLSEWRKSGAIRSIIECMDVDLVKPRSRTNYILSILEDELKKSVEANEPAGRKIRLADAMHKWVETEIKIEILRGKKTTTSNSQEDAAKIINIEAKNE